MRYYYILKNPAMISWQHFGPYLQNQNFARYGIGGQIATISVSILDYFQENPILGAILSIFCQNFGKNEFSGKKGFVSF